MDESEEYLHQTLSSHFKLILSYFETISNLSLSKNFDLDYLEGSIRSLIMKPSTSIFLISIIILLFFSQTFDFWLNIFHDKLPFKLMTRNFLRSGLSSGHLKNVIYELKANQVGVYAIQGRRPHMEDNFSFKFDTLNGECLLNGRKLESLKQSNAFNTSYNLEMIAVFDGHGGSTASNYAQENLLNSFKKSLDELIIDSNLNQCKELNVEIISKILTEQILKLDSILCDRLKKSSDIAGTTALIALRFVNTNELIIANIGDSRGVLCDSKGTTVPLSIDHKPNSPIEFKRIYDNGGFVKFNGVWRVAGILACSRALGDFPLKEKNYIVAEPDILSFKLNDLKPKFAILASDGLFDFFSNEAAVKFVKEKMEELSKRFTMSKNELSLELAKLLTLEAYRRGSTDNITVVVWIFDYEPIKQPTVKHPPSVKELKVQRTKKADELEEIQIRHRSRIEKKIVENKFTRPIENKFAKDITYQTEEIMCDSTTIEFKVNEHLINDQSESQDKATTDETPSKIPKQCSKRNKKFNLLNLELNLNKLTGDKEVKQSLDEKTTFTIPKSEEIINDNSSENDEVKVDELKDDQLDNNQIRLKDEYNLVRSPKKLKNQQVNKDINRIDVQVVNQKLNQIANQIANENSNQDTNENRITNKLKPDQSDEEFFDVKDSN